MSLLDQSESRGGSVEKDLKDGYFSNIDLFIKIVYLQLYTYTAQSRPQVLETVT